MSDEKFSVPADLIHNQKINVGVRLAHLDPTLLMRNYNFKIQYAQVRIFSYT